MAGGTTWNQVACGYITAAVKTDGTLWTWGYNNTYGGLGDGTVINKSSPVTTAGGGTTWSQVAAAGNTTYGGFAAIKTDGTLWTCGNNTLYGALGDGTTVNKSSPVTTAGGGTNWSQVAVSYVGWHAIKTDGTLWGCGYGSSGGLGDGTTIHKSSPVTVAGGGTTWSQVARTRFGGTALKTDGTLWSWGNVAGGGLGDGTTVAKSSPVTVLGGITTWSTLGGSDGGMSAISGTTSTFTITTTATLIAVTATYSIFPSTTIANEGDQLAWTIQTTGVTDGTTIYYNNTGTFNGNTRFVDNANYGSIVVRRNLASINKAIRATNSIDGTSTIIMQLLAVSTSNGILTTATSVSVTDSSTGTTTAYSWTYNGNGQLGDGTTLNRSSPVTVIGGFTDWSVISHGAGIRTNGTLWTWGLNSFGEVGDGTTLNRSSPVTTAGGGTNWSQIACGYDHRVAIKTDGTLWTWGNNGANNLGDGTAQNRSSPITTLGGGTTWSRIPSSMQGGNHVIAVKTDGTLWTWGNNSNGQLGDGTAINRASPVSTVGGANWSQLPGALTGDSLASVAIKTDGTLWTWGRDNYGQLGDGTTVDKSSPITVAGGGTNWRRVNGFMGAISAVKTDGTLWTWGSNGFNGALGDGTTLNRSSPITTAGGGTTWSNAMVNGTGPAVALKTDGTLWAWGGGTAGTAAGVGDGFAVQRSSPVTISGGGTNWYAVSGGWTAAYALSSSTINSAVPTYLIAPTIATAGTGSQVTWFVSTTEVVDGTTLYYTNTGTFNGATRFADGLNYGSVTVLSGFASLTKTIINDGTTNTTTNITLQLRTVSTAGSIIATATSVSVLPTITPTSTYNVYPSSDTVLSNNNLSWYVATTNVADGTPLYYTITGTTTSTFADGALYGSVTVNGNLAAINKFTNLLVSSSSIVAQIRTSSTSGSIVATATTVTASVDSRVVSIQYLVVGGGGGGGGGSSGGGGGAGGLLSASTYLLKGDTITVGVGSGGTGGSSPVGYPGGPYISGTPGNVSFINSTIIGNVIAQGGGVGGGAGPGGPGAFQLSGPGGSGGGTSFVVGYYGNVPYNGGLATNSPGQGIAGTQGYPGGATGATINPSPGTYFAGGGGGAGGAGTSTIGPTSTTANPGGLAALWPYTNTYYAGGGGGGSTFNVTPAGYGGGVAPGNPSKGGGGDGGYNNNAGGGGTANSGGGGGGGGSGQGQGIGGAGGPGVVAIAYSSTSQLFIGGTMTPGAANPAAPGYYVHTFTSTGTLVSAFSSTNYLYYIWGRNDSGQIGDGTVANRSSPTLLAGETNSLSEWKSLPVGFPDRAAGGIKVDGTLWTWGYNSAGRLGDGTTLDRSSPVTTAGGGTNWRQLSVGSTTSAAIKTDGTLWTWGRNINGELGDGTTLSRSSPATTAGGGTTWSQVACGYNALAAAIKTDGTLWTWGYNATYGAVGDGTTVNKSSPVTTAGGGTTWSQVAAGFNTSAAVKTDGTLWTWGQNTYGSVGDGTTLDRSSPVTTVAGGTTWSQVAAGYFTSAAIKSDGTLWTWGYNNNGQLGDGTTLNRSSPVTTVAGGTNWKQVVSNTFAASAIKTDGTLWTWGYNQYGQLGDGTTISRSSPASISSLTWSSIGAFNYGFVALR